LLDRPVGAFTQEYQTMHPLLLILGRGITDDACRPSHRRTNQRAAAMALAHGDVLTALAIYDQLITQSSATESDLVIHASLLLRAQRREEAAFALQTMLYDAMHLPTKEPAMHATETHDPMPSHLEHLLDQAKRDLSSGLFVRALERIEAIMGRVETLIAAQATLAVTEDNTDALTPLSTLVELSDILLRLQARGRLAASLADGLRKRDLRSDLALWATGSEHVRTLLISEFARITEAVAASPQQANLHYRLGLLCRAIGDTDGAIAAFRRVLAIVPHYLPAAARLAACLHRSGHSDDALRLLAAAVQLPDATLRRYYDLAVAATDPAHFARAVSMMTGQVAHREAANIRANLCFALSELALLDESRAAVMQPAAAA